MGVGNKTSSKEKVEAGAAQAGAAPVDRGVPADLLKRASALPPEVVVEQYNPMENIPTLAVGEELKAGMTLAGWYEETQLIESMKFRFAQRKGPNGKPAQLRHILRIGSPTGERLGIWSTGELANTFDKLQPGTFIAITYKGKGLNANNQEQHFFEYKREVPAVQ